MKAILAVAAVALLGSTSAQAVTIRFGGSGGYGGVSTRFMYGTPATPGGAVSVAAAGIAGGACNVSVSQIAANPAGGNGTYGSYNDSVPNVRLVPNGINTTNTDVPTPTNGCYVVVNDVQAQLNNSGPPPLYDGYVNFDGGGITTAPVSPGDPALAPLTYVGFLWGSPDSYNYLQFVDDQGNVVATNNNFDGLGDPSHPGYLTGASIYKALGMGFTRDPGNAGTTFVNFTFDTATEKVAGFRIGNFGDCCFEFGNISYETRTDIFDPTPTVGVPVGATDVARRPGTDILVPEPGAGLALLAGLGLIATTRRRRG